MQYGGIRDFWKTPTICVQIGPSVAARCCSSVRHAPYARFPCRPIVFPEHALVGLPEVTISMGRPVSVGDARPKLAATVRAAVAGKPGHDLPGAAAKGYPHPASIGLAPDK